jgi:hypothetical protein
MEALQTLAEEGNKQKSKKKSKVAPHPEERLLAPIA